MSPDGKWVAYTSDESDRDEIYVQPLEGGGGKSQISTNGGRFARWRPDGREIFLLGLDGGLTVVSVPPGEAFEPGVPAALFQAPSDFYAVVHQCDHWAGCDRRSARDTSSRGGG